MAKVTLPEENTLPVTPARISRALVDVLGGYEGGWALWVGALHALEQAFTDARDGRHRFCSWPPQELRRLLGGIEGALELAAAAVEIQLAINEDPDERAGDRRQTIEAVLHRRAVELARDRARL